MWKDYLFFSPKDAFKEKLQKMDFLQPMCCLPPLVKVLKREDEDIMIILAKAMGVG